ncbi:probable cardiolipin synthase (CMP-forming) isoform X2 [Ornithodoros turicata]|uniref:probable cardiolipin synthase (CMP-forming) isoform X2 n=1 Tax=Ornithodoros turicata TaxID=34597 RepID=UPI0031390A50
MASLLLRQCLHLTKTSVHSDVLRAIAYKRRPLLVLTNSSRTCLRGIRCGYDGISTDEGQNSGGGDPRSCGYPRSRTRLQKTQDSFYKTRDSLRKTKLDVSAHVRETKKIVEERMGNLRENILTVPNGLSFFRLCSTPVIGYLVVAGSFTPALVLFCVSGITDVLDGQIARAFPSQQSSLGTLLDPMADKTLVATLFVTLTVSGLIPVPLTALIILRDAIILGCASYIRYVSLPPPTFHRYFDVSLATVKFSPTTLSKMNTAIQLGLVAATLAAPVFNYVDHTALHWFWYLTGVTTVTSGMMYIFTKDSYKYISHRL